MTYTCCLENNITQGCLLLCTKPDTRRALLEVNETHAQTLHRKVTLGQCAAFKEKIRQCEEYKKYRGIVLLKHHVALLPFDAFRLCCREPINIDQNEYF